MVASGSPSPSAPPSPGRLPGPAFEQVFAGGASVAESLLVLRFRANGTARARWGFAVGRRVSRGAAVRNRLRRRLRAIARSVEAPAGFDLVIVAREAALRSPSANLRAALVRLLRRAEARELR